METPAGQVTYIDETEYKALIERVRIGALDEQDRNWVVSILETFRFIQAALEQKKVAIHKLNLTAFLIEDSSELSSPLLLPY